MASATRKARSAQLTRRTPRLVAVEALARDAGVHPEIVLRFVQLGLLEPRGGTRVAPLFRAQDAFVVARAMRLRRDLGVNYAGAVLASRKVYDDSCAMPMCSVSPMELTASKPVSGTSR